MVSVHGVRRDSRVYLEHHHQRFRRGKGQGGRLHRGDHGRNGCRDRDRLHRRYCHGDHRPVTVTAVGIGASCVNADGGLTPGVCPAGATCVDGVCCMTACTGQCEACNMMGMLGTCVTDHGYSAGTRPGCSPVRSGERCTSMTCDGTSATACTSFVGTDTTCGIPSCIDGIGTPGAVCEGDGGCKKVAPSSCGVFGCVSDQCATSCTNDHFCSPGNYCDVKSGKCIKGAPVPDAGPGGTTTPTSPITSSGCSVGRTSRDPEKSGEEGDGIN